MISRARVLRSRALTPSTHAIEIEKPAGFTFLPVQFCGLEIMTSVGSEEYPMSLACSPTKPYLEFGARIASGTPWKRAFAALKPGDEVEIDGAYGHFVLDESREAADERERPQAPPLGGSGREAAERPVPKARDHVFVAGGIGITPLKGMAEYLTDTRAPHQARLVFSNRSEDEIVYRAELDALENANPRFRTLHTLTREPVGSDWRGRRGRIDAALLREAAADLQDPTWYLCGLPDMVRSAFDMVAAMGVEEDRVVYELFPGYDG